jgi:hypothetical protein
MARCFLLLGAAALLALGPVAAQAGDRYGPEVSAGDEAYAYRRAAESGERYSYERREGEAPANTGCADRSRDRSDGAYTCWEAAESVRRRGDQGGYESGVRYEERDRYEEARYEEDYYEEELYADEYWAEDRYDDRRHQKPCHPRLDERGRAIETCGEIRLSDSFFWGGGGVGPEYIDAGGGGGGGGFAYAGSEASAYASARASVGVSIRIGGKRGHGGKPGHPPKGGGGCCKKH